MKINDLLFSFCCVVVCFGCEAISFFFCKDENIALYLFIHTIQLTLTVFKITPILFCVFPNLQFEKLKHYTMLLMLD